MKYSLNYVLIMVLMGLPGLSPEAVAMDPHYRMEDFYNVPKVDTHMHLHSTRPDFMQAAVRARFKVLSINVDYADFPPIDDQQRTAEILLGEFPQAFAYAATFSVKGYDQPGWSDAVIARIDAAVKKGAVAVKVWKNVGMELRDRNGAMVMIDDPHFRPIFDYLEKNQIPLLGHQGEPKNCWLPLDKMTVSNDRDYFAAHPQYHMYLHPDMPSYEDQMRARNSMLDQHPKLQFVGLHMASLEWSVDELARFLDRYPNANIDLAARIGQLQYQSNRHYEKVRRFLIKYQDRIMYATDLEQDPDSATGNDYQKLTACDQNPTCKADGEFAKEALQTWLRDWRYFNTTATITVPELARPVKGLALPKSVVDKIYSQNAQRIFPGAWGKSSQ